MQALHFIVIRTQGSLADKLELLVWAHSCQYLLQLGRREEELEVDFCVCVVLFVLLHMTADVSIKDALADACGPAAKTLAWATAC